jgi:uncharacterized protein YndB with AHSA1/START domain
MSSEIPTDQVINKVISIHAPAERVWAALTDPALIKKWMSETEIEIITDWIVGHPVIIRGPWYKSDFENKGTVLSFEPGAYLRYSHLSSLSRLPDKTENYTNIAFRLTPDGDHTGLELTVDNFPTEAIYKHFAFYWNVAVVLLKKFAEGQ